MGDVVLGVMQVRQLLKLNALDEIMKLGIAFAQEEQLVLKVAMYGGFHCRSANPYALPAHERGHGANNISAIAPKRHHPAGPRAARRHRRPEQGAVIDFMRQRLFKKRHDIRTSPPRNPNLRPVYPDRAVLTGMVDFEDSGDGQAVIVVCLGDLGRSLGHFICGVWFSGFRSSGCGANFSVDAHNVIRHENFSSLVALHDAPFEENCHIVMHTTNIPFECARQTADA